MEASALPHPVGLGRVSLAGPLLRLRTDDQLVALFRAGHDEAFGIIHDRYRQRLFAYARQMLSGSRSDAEDVLQDVFLRAYHALRADARPVALRAWLYRVAHNRCIDQIRRPAPAVEDIYELNRGVQSDPMAEAERREDLRRLVEDVRRLPEQQRSALLMREMEGLSYQDLAAALDVTVPAVKSLLVRARVGLVEAVEARDTACVEIRSDLVAAFDRGVRASGRSRRHLRECAGCRDYKTALRGIEKQLNSLAPASGPLVTLAKILGIGGAGSGAAAGGGAAVAGGGGAAAVAGGSGVATIGTGAMAATATKVVAVVAAAAVVGGGAATVEKVERQRTTHAPSASHATRASAASHRAIALSAPSVQHRLGLDRHVSVPASVLAKSHRAAAAPKVAHVRESGDTPVSSAGVDVPAYEPTTGGLEAPTDDAATTTTGDGTTSSTATTAGPGGSGTATAGTGTTTGAGSTAGTTTGTTTAAGTTPATSGSTTPAAGSGATPATGAGGTSAPAQTTAPASTPPVAQGATAPPTG